MLRVGIAGIGFMGWIHWLAYQRVPGVQVTAIFTRDEKKLAGDWTSIQGNFGPPGTQVDLSNVKKYRSIDEMLADPDIDLIDNCLPPDMHTDICVAALKKGKHVFCEKPLALSAKECELLVQVAAEQKRLLFAGHVLPFFPEYVVAREIISSGKYGKLLGGTFKRVISDPLWLKDFYDPKRVGGPAVDLHVHDAHLIRMLFGMPESVFTTGRMRGEVVEYFQTIFQFADPSLVVGAVSGVINQQGRGFTHGFEIHLEKATMHFEFAGFADQGESMPLKILTPDGKVERPDLSGGDSIQGFVSEIEEVVRSVQAGKPSPILSGELARDAVILCHKQQESAKLRTIVKV